jgi:tetratricopeptide (TPR) repeat protein
MRPSAIAIAAFTLSIGSNSVALAQVNPGMLYGAQQAQQAQKDAQNGGGGSAAPAPPPAAPPADSAAPPAPAAGGAAPAAGGAAPAAGGAAPAAGGAAPAAGGTTGPDATTGTDATAKPGDTADGTTKKDSDEDSDEKKQAEKEAAEKAAKAEQDKLLKAGYNPVKAAMFDINSGKPKEAIEKLKTVLEKNPKDVQAHYVLAIGYVYAHQSDQAAAQYRTVLKLASPTSKIAQLATEGLKKIAK